MQHFTILANSKKNFSKFKYFKTPLKSSDMLYINKSIHIHDDRVVAMDNIPANTIILKEYPIINLFGEKNNDPALQIILKLSDFCNSNMLYPRDIHISKKHPELKKWIKNMDRCVEKNNIAKMLENDTDYLYHLYEKYLYNAFSMGEYGPIISVYGAKFNHSCDPNVDFYFDTKNGHIIFKTNRRIKKGEELYDTYVDVDLDYHIRQKYLKEHYDFICKCKKCTSENISKK